MISNVKSIQHPCRNFVKIIATLNKIMYLGFVESKIFIDHFYLLFQSTNSPFHSLFVPKMHFVVGFNNIMVNIMVYFTPPILFMMNIFSPK